MKPLVDYSQDELVNLTDDEKQTLFCLNVQSVVFHCQTQSSLYAIT